MKGIMRNKRYLILLGIAVVLLVFFSIASDSFFSVGTLKNLFRQNAALVIVAIGFTFVMLTGGIDLSVGSTAAIAGAMGALVMQSMGDASPLLVAVAGILSSILTGLVFGMLNGFLVGHMNIGAFIATLGTMSQARGLTIAVTNSSRIMIINDGYNWIGQAAFNFLPVTIIPIIAILVLGAYLLKYTRFGRNTYAIGGNVQSAKAAGINTKKHILLVYSFLGMCVGVASIISAARVTSAQALANRNFEFEVITAVILGGTSLVGGAGTIAGTLIGCLIMAIINTGILMMDVPFWAQYFVKAALIIIAVYANIRMSMEKKAAKQKNETPFAHETLQKKLERGEQKVLRLTNIEKSFPGVKALSGVSLEIERGKVHALMGENGAGKSTLMKILSGVYQKDGGEITIDDIPVEIRSPIDSQHLGISVIYQEFSLVPDISVVKNIYLGKEMRSGIPFIMSMKRMQQKSKELLARFGLHINVMGNVSDYKVGQQQMIEIAKAFGSNAWIVVMDEPTSAITETDKESLFKIIRELKESGIAVVYISHRMTEIFEIADTVTVLRDGQHVITASVSEMNEALLIKHMVGRELSDIFTRKKGNAKDDVVLEVKNLSRKGAFAPISFQVKKGEVLGLSGLMGAGRTEICRCIMALDKSDSGEIYLNGKELRLKNPFDAINAGICMVSEDRK